MGQSFLEGESLVHFQERISRHEKLKSIIDDRIIDRSRFMELSHHKSQKLKWLRDYQHDS